MVKHAVINILLKAIVGVFYDHYLNRIHVKKTEVMMHEVKKINTFLVGTNMKKLFLLLLTGVPLLAMNKLDVIRSEETGSKPKLFAVIDPQGKFHGIKREHMDKQLRGMTSHQLLNTLEQEHATLDVTYYENGERGLKLRPLVKGGGYFTGCALAWGTRALGYGVPMVLAGAAVATAAAPIIAGGGVAAAAAGGAAATAEVAIGAAGGAALGAAGTAAAVGTGGATIAAGTVVAGVGTKAAAMGVAAVAASGNYVAIVEGTATGAFIAGSLIWWLP